MPASRYWRFLMVLAALLSPLAMAGAHAQQGRAAASAPVAAAHCPGSEERSPDRRDSSIDCAIACAAIPAVAGALPAPSPPLSAAAPSSPPAARPGLAPEAATPPPRS